MTTALLLSYCAAVYICDWENSKGHPLSLDSVLISKLSYFYVYYYQVTKTRQAVPSSHPVLTFRKCNLLPSFCVQFSSILPVGLVPLLFSSQRNDDRLGACSDSSTNDGQCSTAHVLGCPVLCWVGGREETDWQVALLVRPISQLKSRAERLSFSKVSVAYFISHWPQQSFS